MIITTLGDGAMGTICSTIVGQKAGVEVRLWGRNPGRMAELEASRTNARYLPGVAFPVTVRATGDAAGALAGADLILCAVPAQYVRATLMGLRGFVPAGVPVVSVVKGIENESLLRPTQVVVEVLGPRPVAMLSGPSIAGELARNLPATMVAASADGALAEQTQELFTTRSLRVYSNDDLVGVELAGALKNVIAIAAGILDGMNAGYNAKAALLTRGLVEISRLGLAMGAREDTFAGLAGLGDLVTTCFSPEGRNRSFGQAIGQGESPAAVLKRMTGVVEGMPTTLSVLALAARHRVEMPIARALHGVLFENKNPRQGIAELMARDPKPELER